MFYVHLTVSSFDEYLLRATGSGTISGAQNTRRSVLSICVIMAGVENGLRCSIRHFLWYKFSHDG